MNSKQWPCSARNLVRWVNFALDTGSYAHASRRGAVPDRNNEDAAIWQDVDAHSGPVKWVVAMTENPHAVAPFATVLGIVETQLEEHEIEVGTLSRAMVADVVRHRPLLRSTGVAASVTCCMESLGYSILLAATQDLPCAVGARLRLLLPHAAQPYCPAQQSCWPLILRVWRWGRRTCLW